jgi:hypothetical protein
MFFMLYTATLILLMLCLCVLIDWAIYRLRHISSPSLSSLRARYRSWRYAQSVKGLTIRRVSGKGPSALGSLKVTRARWESLNAGPPEPPAGA